MALGAVGARSARRPDRVPGSFVRPHPGPAPARHTTITTADSGLPRDLYLDQLGLVRRVRHLVADSGFAGQLVG